MTNKRAIVLDCETTGFADEDRVIELAVVDFTSRDTLFHQYFNPGYPIPSKIQEITRITDAMVADCAPFSAYAGELYAIIESAEVVLGYNPSFDKRMLVNEFRRSGISFNWPVLVDAKRIWDVYVPREERTLTNAYKFFVSPDGFDGAHGALADTRATRDVIVAQRARFGLENTSWDQIDPERKNWWGTTEHVTFVEGTLTVNFGKHKGRPVVEVDVGFWRWVAGKDFPPHVLLVAMKMVEFGERTPREELTRRLHTWAEAYAEKNF